MLDHAEPIAIVGMGCRLPGGASSPSKLWDMLMEGRSGYGEMPTSKFHAEAFYHPNADRPGSINSTGGYFINEDTRLFDNSFFGINNVEAKYMDPQQRKLLEVVYECFESAGVCLENISGANVGCYVGNFLIDFQIMQNKDLDSFHRYSATGLGSAILANRVSHVFNLRGPSLTLDTACSSSLYCLHLACTALESGECDAAVVAGANLIQSPEMHLTAVKAGILSETATCHTFDLSADGYGRAEAVGSLYLKRLKDAVRDNDPIRSVIRGTAINSNGKTIGITAPNEDGQEAVIRKAYAKAGISLDETDYVEAHGTGTKVGDPVETEAIARALRRKDGNPLLVGSVKTNLGHSEAVSGISSIIKVAMSLEFSQIPPTIGVINVNPALKLKERNIEVVTTTLPWPLRTTVQRASINGFGYGGANAHVILEAPTAHYPCANGVSWPAVRPPELLLLPLSAAHKDSLESRLDGLIDATPYDLAYTLTCRRSKLPLRGFSIIESTLNLNESSTMKLETLKDAESQSLPLVFVFSGQGAQWPSMGRELIEHYPVYRHAIEEMDAVLSSLKTPPSFSLLDTIMQRMRIEQFHSASNSQPSVTATQIALVLLLREWGIMPETTIGHSSGEIAAAFAAGHISASEAIQIAYYRGLVASTSSADGAMLAVAMSKDLVCKRIYDLELGDNLCIACENSPESVTVSGDASAIDKLLDSLYKQGVFVRKLKTGGMAYHSHHMKALGQAYESLVEEALSHRTSVPIIPGEQSYKAHMVSTVTVGGIDRETVRSSSYWRRNLENVVLFNTTCQKMLQNQSLHLVEIGPHSTMKMPIEEIKSKLGLSVCNTTYTTCLVRGQNSALTLLQMAGSLYIRGHDVHFENINRTSSFLSVLKRQPRVLHDLPKYVWHYDKPLWNESRTSSECRFRGYPRHDLLGSRLPGGSGETAVWRNALTVEDVSWLADHRLEQIIVFPGAGYISIACEALCQLLELQPTMGQALQLRSVKVTKLLVFPDKVTGIEIFTELRSVRISGMTTSESWKEFTISSYIDNTSTVHATGLICFNRLNHPITSKHQLRNMCDRQSVQMWYDSLRRKGMNFGPFFQKISDIWTDPKKQLNDCLVRSKLEHIESSALKNSPFQIVHPVNIDAMLQTAMIANAAGDPQKLQSKVPISFASAQISFMSQPSMTDSCMIRATSQNVGLQNAIISAEIEDSNGDILLQLDQVKVAAYQQNAASKEVKEFRDPILRVMWKPDISEVLLRKQKPGLTRYIDAFVDCHREFFESESNARIGGYLDLLAHKNPHNRVLHLVQDGRSSEIKKFMELLGANSKLRRCRTYTQGFVDGEEIFGTDSTSSDIEVEGKSDRILENESVFDVILATQEIAPKILNRLKKHMASHCVTVNGSSGVSLLRLGEAEGSFATGPPDENAGKEVNVSLKSSETQILIVEGSRGKGGPFNDSLQDRLTSYFKQSIARIPLSKAILNGVPPRSVIIATVELEQPLLDSLDEGELCNLKALTDNASIIVWISGGSLFKAQKPEFSIAQGLARTLTVEQPSLKFQFLNLPDSETRRAETMDNIVFITQQTLSKNDDETEYLQHDGLLYSSRFEPVDPLNEEFEKRLAANATPTRLADAGRAELHIREKGRFDSLYFGQQQGTTTMKLGSDEVEIEVRSIGLNAKDLYVLNGNIDTKNGANCFEFSGIITAVGSDVSKFAAGDRVVAMVPCRFATFQRVPYWACGKLHEDEDFDTASVLGVAFSTALYALKYRARIQMGESLLIHSAAGGVGIAAIQIAHMMGVEVFATVGTNAKKEFLMTEFGIPEDHIFNSHDLSFVDGILAGTSGRGIDVVLNSVTGDLLHESWRLCAEFGRFVEIGKRDILDGGRLGMDVFERNVTYTAFDLSNLFHAKNPEQNKIGRGLLQETLSLLRQQKIRPIQPVEIFDVSDTANAFRRLSSGTRVGKIAISLQNRESVIPFSPPKYQTKFDPEKLYLMVGCLGGLGDSLVKWMHSQGARKFLFLGRSGLNKPAARNLVENLETIDCKVKVVRGDVSNRDDVNKALAEAGEPVHGVVQAAMALHESLFSSMTAAHWNSVIAPKVQGTWNLHHALLAHNAPLDFFLMTSSVNGSIGTATESNYCGANAFLDAFARHRHSLGLTATSVGLGMISEVGYLHEHPEIQELLLRKGLRAINKEEMLHIIDIALANAPSDLQHSTTENTNMDAPGYMMGHFASAHILTGLEDLGLQKQRNRGFEGTSHVVDDPRASILVQALDTATAAPSTTTSLNASSDPSDPSSSSGGRIPAPVAAALAAVQASSPSSSDSPSPSPSTETLTVLSAAVQDAVVHKLRNLLLLEEGVLSAGTQLSRFGMDSMLAAEFRMFVFHAFAVDVPFAFLLGGSTSVGAVVEVVVKGLLEGKS